MRIYIAVNILVGLLLSVRCVSNQNGRYEDINIIIQNTVAEDENLIARIKDVFTDASQLLFHASKQHVYFGQMNIILPKNWSHKPEYALTPSQATLDSYITVEEGKIKGPFTKAKTLKCGDQREYMYVPTSFLQTMDRTKWGYHDAVIVHEWGHFRWGLYDEYPVGKIRFYIKDGKWTPTRCSESISGTVGVGVDCAIKTQCDITNTASVLNRDCRFCPDQSQSKLNTSSIMAYNWVDGVEPLDATNANFTPSMAGETESIKMLIDSKESYVSTAFFAVRAIDAAGNVGPVSNIVSIAVADGYRVRVEISDYSSTIEAVDNQQEERNNVGFAVGVSLSVSVSTIVIIITVLYCIKKQNVKRVDQVKFVPRQTAPKSTFIATQLLPVTQVNDTQVGDDKIVAVKTPRQTASMSTFNASQLLPVTQVNDPHVSDDKIVAVKIPRQTASKLTFNASQLSVTDDKIFAVKSRPQTAKSVFSTSSVIIEVLSQSDHIIDIGEDNFMSSPQVENNYYCHSECYYDYGTSTDIDTTDLDSNLTDRVNADSNDDDTNIDTTDLDSNLTDRFNADSDDDDTNIDTTDLDSNLTDRFNADSDDDDTNIDTKDLDSDLTDRVNADSDDDDTDIDHCVSIETKYEKDKTYNY